MTNGDKFTTREPPDQTVRYVARQWARASLGHDFELFEAFGRALREDEDEEPPGCP